MLWLTTLQIRLAFSLPMSVAWLGMENFVGTNLWKMKNIQRYETENHWYCRLIVTTVSQDIRKSLLWFYSHLASHHSNVACIQWGEVPTQWHHSLSLATASYMFLKRSCLFHNWTLHLLIICFGGGLKGKSLLVNLLELGIHSLRFGWAAFSPLVTPYLKSLYVKSLD